MYYPDEVIEEVRSSNNIVDIIGGYVRLQKRAVPILAYVRFIMRSHRLFPSARINRCITVSDAERAATCLLLLWNMRIRHFRRL